jgi:uncharacterized membrane protein
VANPAYVVLLITGLLMVLGGQFTFETSWIAVSLALYVAVALVGAFVYAPALSRQIAEAQRDPGSLAYDQAARRSDRLGLLTIAAVLVITWLMVTKPSLW